MRFEAWQGLFPGEIEERWRKRFGVEEVERVRGALAGVVGQLDSRLPDCLPILGYGLWTARQEEKEQEQEESSTDEVDLRSGSNLTLATLLSRVLLTFAVDFERESELSLALCANVLRVLNEKGVPVRDLPLFSGVSKEAIAMAMSFLDKKGLVVIGADPLASRGKVAWLTAKGMEAQYAHRRLIARTEKHWRERFGEDRIRDLRESLKQLAGEPLFRGLDPYADGWRAAIRKPDVLPHYPMVLHRGGYPDGS